MLMDKLFNQQLALRGGMHKLIEAIYRGEERTDGDQKYRVSYTLAGHECWQLMLEDTTAFMKERAAERAARRQQEIQFPSSEPVA